MVEWIVGVFVFARSAWLEHAFADCDPGGVGAGPGSFRVEQRLGFMYWVPCYCGVGVGAVEPRCQTCIGPRWQVGCLVGVVARYEVQYGPFCCGCVGVTMPTCAGHLLGVLWED